MKSAAIIIPEGCREVLLHACCAPCSSAIVEWLLQHGVKPTIFYYNPNIYPQQEYCIRKEESKRHAESLGIRWIDGDYDHEAWQRGVSGLESEPERGRRCEQCFTLRLLATARKAQELGMTFFATTLASSRWKNLEQVNRAGLMAAETVNAQQPSGSVSFWPQNWRKGGLQDRRNQLLKEYHFYNQQYCGCEYSVRQSEALTKPQLRQLMRQAKQRHADQLPSLSADVCRRLSSLLADAKVVMAYWPLPDEVDIRPLLDMLATSGKTVLLPKVTGDETMELHRYTSRDEMAEGAFHIMEPTGPLFAAEEQIDVALIPGVAFDAACHRLGRGKGYYDRFLSRHLTASTSHPSPRLIGVCFPFQRVADVPSETHDVVMDEVVS